MASQPYIIIAIAVLLVIGLVVFLTRKKKKRKMTTLTGIAFVCIIAGIAFGDTRLVGYSLIGAGVVLAVIDMILKIKKK